MVDPMAFRNRTRTPNTMKDAAPEAATGGTPIDREGPVAALLCLSSPARFSRSTDVKIRIAPQICLHGISIMFERTRDRRFITITRSNRPETVPSTRKWQPHKKKRQHLSDGQNIPSHVTPLPARPWR
jgi:hypothetical protein